MTNLAIPGPYHRHVDYDSGCIYHADPITGEVIAVKQMFLPDDREAAFQAWGAERRADERLPEDQAKAAAALEANHAIEAPEVIAKATRGRPKTTYQNPVAAYMHLIAVPDQLPWVDSIIHGSIITSAGVNNGKINVKTRTVLNALFLSDITAAACQTDEIVLRTAQRIAKAARHAAHGIASYVERHPLIKAEIEAELG